MYEVVLKDVEYSMLIGYGCDSSASGFGLKHSWRRNQYEEPEFIVI